MVGHIAMYKGLSYSAEEKYPGPDQNTQITKTHPGIQDHSWGASCKDGDLLECQTANDCAAVNDDIDLLECFRGVCIIKRTDSDFCYQHLDCQGRNKMCSGEGKCEDVVWQVENALEETDWDDNTIEFDLFTDQCTASSGSPEVVPYDMYGGSKWESIPDILAMYGMCSYRNWYEYRQFVEPDPTARPVRPALGQSSDPGTFQANARLWWDTDSIANDIPTVENTKKFRVLAHPCDRDYMHTTELLGCAPVEGLVLEMDTRLPMGISLDRSRAMYAQTIRRDKAIYIQKYENDWFDDKSFGFLSTRVTQRHEDTDAQEFKMCRNIEQCSERDFHFNGATTRLEVYDAS